MSYVLTKFLELHVVHDPDKGEAAVELIAAADDKRVRYTVKGRYGHSGDEPTASLDVNQPTYETGLQLFREVLPAGPPRFAVELGCHMDAMEMKRELLSPDHRSEIERLRARVAELEAMLPTGTDGVAPPSGDEINK